MTSQMLKKYYSLTKPGVMYGNVLTGVAGFLLASRWHIDIILFIATIVGMSLVVSAACALNNYLDRDIDSHMARTKTRATVTGEVSPLRARNFAIILAALGFLILLLWSNLLVVAIGIVGFIVYVWLYGAWTKRQSVHGTLVGSISGAMPILAGYVAARGHFDSGAAIVFFILFFWQLPEFYSISIYRRDEYKAAGLPVMSVVKGTHSTKVQIYIYTLAFVITSLLLTAFGYTGYTYALVMGAFGLYWLRLAMKGLSTRIALEDDWARRMFRFSLVMILVLSVMLSFGAILP